MENRGSHRGTINLMLTTPQIRRGGGLNSPALRVFKPPSGGLGVKPDGKLSDLSYTRSKRVAYFSAAFVAFFIIALTGGCTKHLSGNTVKAGQSPEAAKATAKSLRDTLIGTWLLQKIEVPDMLEKMRAFSSQADKDDITRGLTKYQEGMKGLKVTFNRDSSYTTVYSGPGDAGTWTLDKREIGAHSQTDDHWTFYQIVFLDADSLTVKFNPGDMLLQMSFKKK